MTARQTRWLLPLATLALMAGILLGRSAQTAVYAVAGMGAALLAACFLRGRRRVLAFLVAVVCLGCCAGQRAYHPVLPESGMHAISGVVAAEVRDGKKNQHKTLLRSVTVDGQALNGGAYWSFYTDNVPEVIAPGAAVSFTARTYEPAGADNPGGYDFRESLLQQGVVLGVYGFTGLTATQDRFNLMGAAARWRQQLTDGLIAVMGQEAGGLAATMLLGVRDLVPDEDRAAFNTLGIAHVLSVSGYHVGVLTLLLAGMLRLLRVPRRRRWLLLAPVLCGYALLTGLHAPVVRASLLVLLGEIGVLRHRRRVNLHLLCASACILLLFAPAQLTGVSFQLTYGALLGLTLVTPWLSGLLVFRTRRAERLWQLFCAGMGAQLGLLLPEMYWFQSLPALGLVFNLLVMAAMQVVLAGCWLTLALMAVPGVGLVLGQISAAMLHGLLWCVRTVGRWQWLLVWTRQAGIVAAVGCGLLLAATSFLWRSGRRTRLAVIAAGVALTVLGVVPWPHTGVDYTQLSVGNADAAILHDRGDVTVIDTGEGGTTLTAYLKQRRLSIDRLILTHLHSDHAGGVATLLEEHIPIRKCYLPAGAQDVAADEELSGLIAALTDAGVEIVTLSRGDVLDLPDGTLTVVWPETGRVRAGQDANLYSLVMRAEVLGTSLLLTGDLDGAYEGYAALPSDILKAAHHGSASATLPDFLASVSPQAVIVSCGDMARQEGIAERAGEIPVFGTQARGAVRVTFSEHGFTIREAR